MPVVLGRDADVIDTGKFHAVVDPIAVFRHARVGAHVLANHSAPFCRCDDQRIGRAARPVEQCPAGRMAEDHRLLGEFHHFHRRAVAGVRQVDDDAELVHTLDGFLAKRSKTGVDFGGIAAAIIAVLVESEGETAQSKIVESIQQAQAVAQGFGILQPEQHPDFVLILLPFQIGGAPENVSMGMIAHDRFDRFEVFDAFESVVPGEIGGAADDGDALLAQLIDKHRREIFRPGRAEAIHDGLLLARCTHGKVTSCFFIS